MRHRKKIAAACIIAASVIVAGILTGIIGTVRSIRDIRTPSFGDVRASYRVSDAHLLDRNGEVIHVLRTDSSGRRLEWAGLSEISPSFLRTVVLAEDRRFFSHHGIDIRAFAAAFIRNLTAGKLRGASTISMQVASIVNPALKPGGGRRNLIQKWRQILTAIALERRWTKNEILETYVNFVYYRGELQGVRSASKGLFGKEPSGLTEAESLVLASLITSPNARRDTVAVRSVRLARRCGMEVSGEDIGQKAQEALAKSYHIAFDTSLAPHVARILLARGQTKATTSLDGRIQRFAIESLQSNLAVLRTRNVSDGAVLVADNATGEILAYVGNSGATSSAVWMDGVRSRRQAGSTLKPFLYELAIEKGYLTASSILDDTPLSIMTPTGLYVPQNYDNQFRGTVSVRTALASSLNVPAVKTLLVAGLIPFVERLKVVGFKSITEEPEFYGYSIALGSADVELWELVDAYHALAAGGERLGLKLAPRRGAVARTRVMDGRAAFIISHILSDRESRAATFGLENPLSTRFWTAVKTGTSKDMRDNWCVGYSRRYTVGVWVGNFSGEPMRDVSGISGAAPIWLEIMNFLHASTPSHTPKAPPGITTARVAFDRGIEPSREEVFLTGTEPVARIRANTVYEEVHIVYPQEGTLITLDPDIPASLQKVGLRFEPAGKRFRWMINGGDAGSDGSLFLWEPRPGTYTVSIVDQKGRIMDSVGFIVR